MPTLTRDTAPTAALVDQIEALTPAAPWQPTHEFVSTEREVRLFVDLPGVLKENLHVDLHEGRLYIWGGRTPTHVKGAVERTSTRVFGDFALDVPIPDWVDGGRAFQVFDGAILTVAFPKRRASQPSRHAAR